jgi:hypothetical protein
MHRLDPALTRPLSMLGNMRRLWQHRQTCAFMPAVGGLRRSGQVIDTAIVA